MFGKKIFALFVLLGALGVLVLFYLYFFVYYTATLIITSNEEAFRGELISVRNAQIRPFICSESPCTIPDVPPFQYRLVLHKEDFRSLTVEVDMRPRSTIEVAVDFERQARLSLTSVVTQGEFVSVEVDSESVFARFERGDESIELRERVGSERLDMYFITTQGEIFLRDVIKVPLSEIVLKTIRDTSDIHIGLAGENFIYEYQASSLLVIPLQVPVRYIKKSHEQGKYHIVTELGSFIYTKQTHQVEYQYSFRDYVVIDAERVIGVIYPEDEERKQNFGFENERGTLIVLQNPKNRERKILLHLTESLEEIHLSSGIVTVITSEGASYRLENF